jgi:hypothetical protein
VALSLTPTRLTSFHCLFYSALHDRLLRIPIIFLLSNSIQEATSEHSHSCFYTTINMSLPPYFHVSLTSHAPFLVFVTYRKIRLFQTHSNVTHTI